MSDVCLILEGTYPFVAGGVSTWIHQLITSMSDLRFSILYISPFPHSQREYKYPLPSNLVDLQDLFLHDYTMDGKRTKARPRREAFEKLHGLHEQILKRDWESFSQLVGLVRKEKGGVTFLDIFDSLESWRVVQDFYNRYGEEASFLDFFWTWRSMYLPLMNVLTIPIPKARLYHTVSTGYAGLLASVAKITQNKKMLLTEHGVYTHERLLEIAQASWIYSPQRERFRIQRQFPFFKRFWIGLFKTMGSICYHFSDRIVTLYEGNRTRQILDGADPDKIAIIPNGINLELYRGLRPKGPATGRPTVAYIGRIVPIKDVKTFLHACKIVLESVPEAEFFILGPSDEEPEYTAECQHLVSQLGLWNSLRFTGKVDVLEYYPRIDVVVLTSLSEAQPYVVLEANAAGIPVVATEVGACREMLEGRLPEDRRIGPSGIFTQVSNPEETAAAILRLLKNPGLWNRMSEAGRSRSLRFYDQNDLLGQYLNLYEQNMQ